MAEIYAPERGRHTPERAGQTKPARQTSKAVITIIAVAAIVILLLALIL